MGLITISTAFHVMQNIIERHQAKPSQAKPSQAKVITGERRLAWSASRRPPIC